MDMNSPKHPCYIKLESPLRHDGILEQIFQYVGARAYCYVAGVSKHWKRLYVMQQPSISTSTSYYAVHSSEACLKLAWDYGCKVHPFLLSPATQLLLGRFASLSVLTLFGNGVHWPDEFLRGAAQSGCIAKVSWLHSERNLKLKGHLTLPASISVDAAAGGSVAMLSWLLQRCTEFTAKTCAAAARAGHTEALKWLFERGCSWSAGTIATDAAASGSVQLVAWLLQQGPVCTADTMAVAVAHGHTALCKYLLALQQKEQSTV
jgi:hypothetical protein